MDAGLVSCKKQAQKALKYQHAKGILFTLRDTRPQQYYPSAIDLSGKELFAKEWTTRPHRGSLPKPASYFQRHKSLLGACNHADSRGIYPSVAS